MSRVSLAFVERSQRQLNQAGATAQICEDFTSSISGLPVKKTTEQRSGLREIGYFDIDILSRATTDEKPVTILATDRVEVHLRRVPRQPAQSRFTTTTIWKA